MPFTSPMGLLKARSWTDSSPFSTHLLSAQSYQNLMLHIIYMQMIYKFIWNLTQGILTKLANYFETIQVCMENNKVILDLDKTEFILERTDIEII